MSNNKITELESRMIVAPLKIERRSENEGEGVNAIEGTAALFNNRTKIGGWFYEEVLPGAFDDVLGDDVRCLINHDPRLILGRTASGTLELWQDNTGLKYRYTTPDRTYAKDLEDAIRSGDVSQSSFQFKTKESIWIEQEDDLDIRQIKKVERLYDVSPVTYPAYEDTSVAKRSFDLRQETQKRNGKTLRELQVIINKNKYQK
jgi:HK97 family phage prohead protease